MKSQFLAGLLALAASSAHGASPSTEGPFLRTRTRPEYVQQGGASVLRLRYADRTWDYPADLLRDGTGATVLLETNRTYVFEFRLTEDSGSRPPELVSIGADGRKIYDSSVCAVHRRRLLRQEVARGPEPQGSAPPPAPVPPGAMRAFFPHADTTTAGVCVFTRDGRRVVATCSECTRAFQAWTQHREPPASVLPGRTPYDRDRRLAEVYRQAFGNGYVDACGSRERIPVFGPVSAEDKARVLGYSEGTVQGRRATQRWHSD